jgi:hypothetical protein
MAKFDPQTGALMLQALLQPWHQSIENPVKAQDEVLHRILIDFAKTGYGTQYVAQIESLEIIARRSRSQL